MAVDPQPPVIEAPVTVVPPGTVPGAITAEEVAAPKPVIPEVHTITPPVFGSPLDTKDNLAAKTTAEQDKRTSGQRRINLVWEITQAIIAVSVTGANIYCAINNIESASMSNAFTLVIAVYFVRMNHIKTGGVGGTDSR